MSDWRNGSVPYIVSGTVRQPPITSGVVSLNKQGEDAMYKAVIPKFLYRPPYGYPRDIDIPELRRISTVPHNWAADNAIINIISAVPWEIVPTDPEEEMSAKQTGKTAKEKECDAVKSWFDNCNVNQDCFDNILKMSLWDVLGIDSGVWNKVFNRKGEFMELFCKDGGIFTKNPDVFGTYADTADIIDMNYAIATFGDDKDSMREWLNTKPAYFQYGWSVASRITPFGRRELVWLEMNTKPNDIYGRSSTEILANILQVLIYGVDYNLDYFIDNNIPKGVFSADGADEDWIAAFRKQWNQTNKVRNEVGDWRRRFHHMPVIGTKGEFIRVQFSNSELELLGQQAWFSKLVWACKGIAPSELGMDDHPTKAHQIASSEASKRRIIRPMLQAIQRAVNNNIITEFEQGVRMHKNHPDAGKLIKATDIKFQFNLEDIGEDTKKIVLMERMIRSGIKTPNEVREELGLPAVEEGNKIRTSGGSLFDNSNETSREEDGTSEDTIGEQEEKAMSGNPNKNPLIFNSGEEPATPEKVEDAILYLLRESKKKMIDFLKQNTQTNVIKQIKGFDRSIIEQVKDFLNLNQSESVMGAVIEASFLKALDDAGKEIGNVFQIDKNMIDFLKGHALDRVDDLEEEMKNDLKAELERGVMNGEGIAKLSKRVDDIFDKGTVRAKAIARTEVIKASNEGLLNGYKQSGIKGKKQYVAKMDNRTSELCKRLNGQKVGMNSNFIDPKGTWEGRVPPAHVNCRSRIIFVPD